MPSPLQPSGPLRMPESQPRGWVRFHSATWVRITAAATPGLSFDLGADFCRPQREHRKVEPLRITERRVTWIESRIDSFNAGLSPLDSFVLPSGSHAAAHLHHARTVVRRAERYMTEIAYQEPANPAAIRYANRLSDLLFVLARYLNDKGQADVLFANTNVQNGSR